MARRTCFRFRVCDPRRRRRGDRGAPLIRPPWGSLCFANLVDIVSGKRFRRAILAALGRHFRHVQAFPSLRALIDAAGEPAAVPRDHLH
jgi:hypothetical protein